MATKIYGDPNCRNNKIIKSVDEVKAAIANLDSEGSGGGSGYIVADNTERDAILEAERKLGMDVLVLSGTLNNIKYRLKYGLTNNDWAIDEGILINELVAGCTVTTTDIDSGHDTMKDPLQILHQVGAVTVRQDDFTYPDTDTIVEKRTCLLTNEKMTITYTISTGNIVTTAITKVVA